MVEGLFDWVCCMKCVEIIWYGVLVVGYVCLGDYGGSGFFVDLFEGEC